MIVVGRPDVRPGGPIRSRTVRHDTNQHAMVTINDDRSLRLILDARHRR